MGWVWVVGGLMEGEEGLTRVQRLVLGPSGLILEKGGLSGRLGTLVTGGLTSPVAAGRMGQQQQQQEMVERWIGSMVLLCSLPRCYHHIISRCIMGAGLLRLTTACTAVRFEGVCKMSCGIPLSRVCSQQCRQEQQWGQLRKL
jgi:hypothetical protein